jgi:hypothetical protein
LPEPTPPVLHLPATITAEATSAAGAVVTYDATATDARDTNIAVSCTPASGTQFPLGSTAVSCSATNSRHKTAEGSFVVLVVDTTAPSVMVNGVSNGATYTLGAVPVASCSTTDFASGVAIPATLSISGGTARGVGHFTATCSGAKDVAGNLAAPVSASYDVHYAFNGFLSPLTPGPSAGSFNAGRTLPLKWQLRNAQGRSIHARSAILAVQAAANSTCQLGGEGARFTVTSRGEDELEVEDGMFHLNWNTKGLATGCYSLLLSLDDGTTRSAVLRLR